MIGTGAIALMFFGLSAPPEATPPPAPKEMITIRRQIIIRSVRVGPGQPGQPAQSQTPILWRESKGPRCLPARAIAGASLLGQRSVDLILRNRTRIRTLLGSNCPALDYYHGFYLTPGEDGLICVGRETVRSRVGGECEIGGFRVLRPVAIAPPRLTSDDR